VYGAYNDPDRSEKPLMPATRKTRAPAAAGKAAPRPYHHGNLRQALIDAAVQLAGEGGPEHVTVREAARRAGVSPGAPFRHFPSREALLTAVAEEAMQRFRAEIAHSLDGREAEPPLQRLRALGAAFLHWALRNPTHFRIISSRHLIDFDGSAVLRRDNLEVRRLSESLLQEAQGAGQMQAAELPLLALTTRALVYGLARMEIDGQLPQWDVPGPAEPLLLAAMELFVGMLELPSAAG
jgi:AcrR family transcriptional regulator